MPKSTCRVLSHPPVSEGPRYVPPLEGAKGDWQGQLLLLLKGGAPGTSQHSHPRVPNLNISLAAASLVNLSCKCGCPPRQRGATARAGERRPIGGADSGICNVFLWALESFTNAIAGTPGSASQAT